MATCLDFDDGQHYQKIDRIDLSGAFWGQDNVFLPSSMVCNCFRPMVGEILAIVFAKFADMIGHGSVSDARMSDHVRHHFISVLTQNSCTHFFHGAQQQRSTIGGKTTNVDWKQTGCQ
jgi:hypothetical protein